jgi:hypothetical protein
MQCSNATTVTASKKEFGISKKAEIDPRRMAIAAAKACDLMKTLGHKDRLMVLCHL